MRKFYAVDGKLPNGRKFRGYVAATANDVVLAGPHCLAGKPWDKQPLLIPELRKLARVKRCKAPRLGATIEEQIAHKFKYEIPDEGPHWTRAMFKYAHILSLVEVVREKMARDA